MSEPFLSKFDPKVIPYQYDVIKLINNFDYTKANLEVLLSGAVGSAKSILMAHIIVTDCLFNPGAQWFVGRRSLPDLKKTIWAEILEHMDVDLIEDKHYFYNKVEMSINFVNGSRIIGGSWADRKFAKFRSLKLSGVAIEELTENGDEDQEAIKQLKMRLRRVPKAKRNIFIAATNPDEPAHWAYKYFIEGSKEFDNRRVFYSITKDNPFLDPAYIEQLLRDLSEKEARRFVYGEWIELRGEYVYHEYNSQAQYLRKTEYQLRKDLPIHLTYDFNIGYGKPMSCCLFQYHPETESFHFFAESVVEGARTASTIEELDGRGLLNKDFVYEINGDFNGNSRDTRGTRSDYDIIKHELAARNIQFKYCVPAQNPPIRVRHNKVNAYCKNGLGQVRLFVYKGCKKIDEGMRLVQIKKGASYLEDDSKDYQHITTAVGYGIWGTLLFSLRKPQGSISL